MTELWAWHTSGGAGLPLTQLDDRPHAGEMVASHPRYLYFSSRNGRFEYNHDPIGSLWQVERIDRKTGEFSTVAFGSGSASRPMLAPDGKRLVSGSSDKTVKVWDASSGQELRSFNGHTGQVGGVVFSTDRKWIASASYDGTAKLWDAATGQETRTLRGHQGGVSCVAISPDGKRLVTGSSDQTVKLWDIAGLKPIPVPTGEQPTIAKSPAKSVTISGAPVSLTLLQQHRGFTGVAFSADGQRLATASIDQAVKVWDATSGQELHTLKAGWCATFSPDGKRLASGGPDKVVRVFDAASGQESLTLPGHTNSVVSVAFSPDGTRLASASQDQTVKVWDVTNGKESLTLKGHTGDVRSVAFSRPSLSLPLRHFTCSFTPFHVCTPPQPPPRIV